jgi:hypothetical protein
LPPVTTANPYRSVHFLIDLLLSMYPLFKTCLPQCVESPTIVHYTATNVVLIVPAFPERA